MTHWLEPQDIPIPESLLKVVGGDPLVAATLLRRGLTTPEAALAFLEPAHYRPAPATDLPELDIAADRLDEALRHGELVGVWGDFDADGVTSTALLVEALRDLGGRAEFYVPDRLTESHGVHLPSLQKLISGGIRVLLTCDTGTTDNDAIAYARGQGVDVIITDHHDLGPEMPRATAFVNPKRLPVQHPLRELSGVGTAYKLVEELYSRRGSLSDAEKGLDLVALGMVADVAALRGDVRYLVQRGIDVLRHTQRMGMQALLEAAEIRASGVTEEQIGFGLAPRLNALGRLSEATAAVELFTTRDIVRARTIATEMEALNIERQLLCNQVMAAAVSIIERDPALLREPVLVVARADWPVGVIGIVAGRLARRYERPAVVISTSSDGMGRGSARSISGVDIRAAIAAQAELLHRFGGHPMAAGLSLSTENIPAFREGLGRAVRRMVGEKLGSKTQPTLEIAAYLPLSQLSLDLAAQIERLAPFGAGNPPLVLAARQVKLLSHTALGRTGEHLRLTVEDEAGDRATVLWWHGADMPLPEGPFDLAFTLRARDYLGRPEPQLEWQEARAAGGGPVTVQATQPPVLVFDHTDCRTASQPEALLHDLLASPEGENVAVWGEGLTGSESAIRRRDRLSPAETLIIWTVPPGPAELARVLEIVTPQRVVLFAQTAGLDEPQPFLSRLAGLVKYDVAARAGRCRVSELAAVLGHREGTVRKGIAWLVARGQIAVVSEDEEGLTLALGDRQQRGNADLIYRELQALLAETAAYRGHFRRAEAQTLMPHG